MRLILTRHGETEENRRGILQGHLDGTLSDLGISQAIALGKRLACGNISACYSSDLARAYHTSLIVMSLASAKFGKTIFPARMEILREHYLGQYQGKDKKDLNHNWKEEGLKNGEIEPPEKVFGRANAYLTTILRAHQEDTVLTVTHNSLGRGIVCAVEQRPPYEIYEMGSLRNTSVTIYEISKDRKFERKAYNCARHLNELL